jgi:hypothetical protein
VGDGSLTAAPQQKLSTKGIRRVVQVVDDRVLVFDPPEENPIAQYSKTIVAGGRKTKDMRYAFDRVFDERCTQEDVWSRGTSIDDRCSRILLNRFWMVYLMVSTRRCSLTVQQGVERHILSGTFCKASGINWEWKSREPWNHLLNNARTLRTLRRFNRQDSNHIAVLFGNL